MSLTIRSARPSDAEQIVRFNRGIALETENLELDRNVVDPGVAYLLEHPADGRYWLAEQAGDVVGQIMVTYEWSDWRNGRVWWIQSVYVHPDHRRQGVFGALYRHVETLAIEDPHACGLRLYVEENNTGAQASYRSLGMDMSHYRVMEVMFEASEKESEAC